MPLSLSLSGMGPAFVLDGAADSVAFALYVEQILAPSLQAGQIVILDNLSIHLGPRVRQAIEARGCRLLFLPAYSPDFSPIEEAFSKLKLFCGGPGLAHVKICKKPLRLLWTSSPVKTLSDGSLIVATRLHSHRRSLTPYEQLSRVIYGEIQAQFDQYDWSRSQQYSLAAGA